MNLSAAQVLGATFRDKEKLMGAVGRHLLKKRNTEVDDYAIRGLSSIHPSEMSHNPWCGRSTYYRLTGVKPDLITTSLAMELTWEDGNIAHLKFQRYFREMGILRGMWKCLWCHLYWYDISPQECPRCEVGEDLIEYKEVPFSSDKYLIQGQADGDVLRGLDDWVLIEAKTIGPGTIRIDNPKLYAQYIKTPVDQLNKIWSAIRYPFPSHLRQGMIYLFCSGRKEIIFLYDPKFVTAYPKEFSVKFTKSLISDVLEQCTIIRNAIEAQRRPKRPMWATKSCSTCKYCPFQSTCWENHSDSQSDSTNLGKTISRKAEAPKARASSSA